MAIVRQQFGRAFSNTFGTFTSFKAVVVKKEPQQIQIIVADIAAKEKVVSQTTVEILYNGACPRS